MIKSKKYRKSMISVLIIFISAALSGCFTLKNIPANDMGEMSKRRNIIQIHAGDSTWNITNIRITRNELVGQIYSVPIKPQNVKVSHIYVAPYSAVKSDKNFITVAMDNIGKADYFAVSWPPLVGLFFVAMLFFAII